MKNKKIRRGPLPRDDFWMGMAFVYSAGSNHPNQGAVIVGVTGDLITMAYDGIPKSFDEKHTIHAELSALLNAKVPLLGGCLYLTHPPCYLCSTAIAASGIKRVVYCPTKPLEENSEDVLRSCYVQCEEFKGNLHWMRDYVKSLSIFG